jgi:UDP:flavonoid glycosyltransferase YjiC (YdhE family)
MAANVTLIALGSRGDVEPFIALAERMAGEGFTVTVATHFFYQPGLAALGLRFCAVTGDPRSIVQQETGQSWLESGESSYQFVNGLRRVIASLAGQIFEDCREACRGADLIIASRFAAAAAVTIAREFGIPFLPANLQPVTPTTKFPSIYYTSSQSFGPALNWFSHVVSDEIYWLIFREFLVKSARRANFSSLPWWVPKSLRGQSLLAVSPSVIPANTFASPCVHLTGYWFLDAVETWEPPPGLEDFLSSGTPPLCVGFGSMTTREPRRLAQAVLAALRQIRRRAILLRGWGALDAIEPSDDVFMVEEAPHAWLFPKVAAVVHHGGAGTTAAGLRARRPSLAMPFFADQHFWGARLQKLGVGPKPIPQAEANTDEIAAALGLLLETPDYAANAKAIGDQILLEDGPGAAVAAVKNFLLTRMAGDIRSTKSPHG